MTRKLHFWDLFTFFESESQYMFKKKKKKKPFKNNVNSIYHYSP